MWGRVSEEKCLEQSSVFSLKHVISSCPLVRKKLEKSNGSDRVETAN
ncbi:hypothetical protein CKA32_006294 [Geitlerinema sp. FC II]|nr:hypothetical protein CKA32_006294 [Geitlerinema sp. FC II]